MVANRSASPEPPRSLPAGSPGRPRSSGSNCRDICDNPRRRPVDGVVNIVGFLRSGRVASANLDYLLKTYDSMCAAMRVAQAVLTGPICVGRWLTSLTKLDSCKATPYAAVAASLGISTRNWVAEVASKVRLNAVAPAGTETSTAPAMQPYWPRRSAPPGTTSGASPWPIPTICPGDLCPAGQDRRINNRPEPAGRRRRKHRRRMNTDERVFPAVQVVPAGGHTPRHASCVITADNGARLTKFGDALRKLASLAHLYRVEALFVVDVVL